MLGDIHILVQETKWCAKGLVFETGGNQYRRFLLISYHAPLTEL